MIACRGHWSRWQVYASVRRQPLMRTQGHGQVHITPRARQHLPHAIIPGGQQASAWYLRRMPERSCSAPAGPGPGSVTRNAQLALQADVAAPLKPRGETAGGGQPHRKAREMVRSMSAGGDVPTIGMCSRPAVRTSPHHGPASSGG
jgi:hypothetical protein